MNFTLETCVETIEEFETELLVVPVPISNGHPALKYAPDLPEAPFRDFEGKKGETRLVYEGEFQADRCLIFGIGEPDDLEEPDVTEIAGDIFKEIDKLDVEVASVLFPLYLEGDRTRLAQEWSNGIRLSAYEFDQYQSDPDPKDDEEVELDHLCLLVEDGRSASTVERGMNQGIAISDAVSFSRDLANQPANELTPNDLAEQAESLADEFSSVSVDIWDQDDLLNDEMNLLNAVGKGSENPPRLIRIDYNPGQEKRYVGLAGKGVTFDTGGISIKPSKKMDEMKFDMCGAATVLGIVRGLAALEWPVRVTGLVPCAENMPGHRSVKPGDVVKGYAGKSVEILNTDAEGRLCLADALGYISDELGENLDYLIDFATLTGACITALGHEAAGLMGNDDDFCRQLTEAGDLVDERVWQLPLWDDHTEQMDSDIADVKNIGGKAGAITAGAFLRTFVDEDKIDCWAHLDIAGTGWGMESLSYRPEGGTGFGVRLVLRFFEEQFSL